MFAKKLFFVNDESTLDNAFRSTSSQIVVTSNIALTQDISGRDGNTAKLIGTNGATLAGGGLILSGLPAQSIISNAAAHLQLNEITNDSVYGVNIQQ